MQIRESIMMELGALMQRASKQQIVDCRKALDLSEITMNKYLSGSGSKIDIYQNILNYLRNAA